MESRKSLRLMDQQHDVDFARLADGGLITSEAPALAIPRKRGSSSSSSSSSGIDVPGANSGQVPFIFRRFPERGARGENWREKGALESVPFALAMAERKWVNAPPVCPAH